MRPRAAKNPKSCHERALGLLAVRPRARRELERRLLAAGFQADEVDDVLVRLERVGLIDDEAFARQLADHQFGSRHAGRRAVTSALLAKGIAPTSQPGSLTMPPTPSTIVRSSWLGRGPAGSRESSPRRRSVG